ncbi:MAG: cytochrome B [Crocinitomix sp.]|nr:cytochrome B [Crocinitomix sp.]
MDTFKQILISSHSGWRWIVLILLLAAVVKMHMGWKGKKTFVAGDRKLALFAMMAFHLQYLFGWILYLMSDYVQFSSETMSTSILRFFTLEHSLMMTIAFILITMGYSKSKKKDNDTARFKVVAVFYTIALVVVLAGIPWPFREMFANVGIGWF